MFTLLCIPLRLPHTFRCVSCASNVGYFLLWKPSLKSVMFRPLCIALRLSDTFMGVSRAVENGKTSFLALDFRKTGTSQISQKQMALRFSFRGPIRTHALKKSLTKTDVASLIQRSLDIT